MVLLGYYMELQCTLVYKKLRSGLNNQSLKAFCDFKYSKFLNSFSNISLKISFMEQQSVLTGQLQTLHLDEKPLKMEHLRFCLYVKDSLQNMSFLKLVMVFSKL